MAGKKKKESKEKEAELKRQKQLEEEQRERARLVQELEEIESITARFKDNVETQTQQKQDWNKYVACSFLPDPKIERDVNTFLQLWEHEPFLGEKPSLDPLFAQVPDAELLLSQLEAEKALAIDTFNEKRQKIIQEQMERHSDIMMYKWNLTTQKILQHLDFFEREPNENFQLGAQKLGFAVGLWGNLTKNPRHKLIEFEQLRIAFTLPKPLALGSTAIRVIYNTNPNCVSSPSGDIKPIQYPFAKQGGEQVEEGSEGLVDDSIWPTTVSFHLPPHSNVHEESAQVMWWDQKETKWRKDGITDYELNMETGQVKFRTIHFAPVALVQSQYCEFPFSNWLLEPVDRDVAHMTITGKHSEIKIQIEAGQCRIVQPMNSFIKRVAGDAFSPSLLLKRLSHIGYNFCGPKSMSGHYKAEEQAIQAISQFAHSLRMRRSPSNKLISSAKLAFQIKDNDDPEREWCSLLVDVNYKHKQETITCAMLLQDNNITEDTKFKFRSTAYHVLSSMPQKYQDPSPLFVQTVAQVLQSTRVLSFS
ncbi:hypothetical protein EDD86DRAFT_248231 [Gorgonomyces haynaldii]|nr:hypothetical protein EDD86DRAFT_248231 [Gorgonomyces haynaldii]